MFELFCIIYTSLTNIIPPRWVVFLRGGQSLSQERIRIIPTSKPLSSDLVHCRLCWFYYIIERENLFFKISHFVFLGFLRNFTGLWFCIIYTSLTKIIPPRWVLFLRGWYSLSLERIRKPLSSDLVHCRLFWFYYIIERENLL